MRAALFSSTGRRAGRSSGAGVLEVKAWPGCGRDLALYQRQRAPAALPCAQVVVRRCSGAGVLGARAKRERERAPRRALAVGRRCSGAGVLVRRAGGAEREPGAARLVGRRSSGAAVLGRRAGGAEREPGAARLVGCHGLGTAVLGRRRSACTPPAWAGLLGSLRLFSR